MHLFGHLQKNDNKILDLLSSKNNDLFLRYFKNNLVKLVKEKNLDVGFAFDGDADRYR